jgi:iduronate 2-sulfatase
MPGCPSVDAQIGRVLDALDREGLADNTIVVVWGDNGYSFGTHGDWTKHSNYEEANHIPVIFAGPGISRGKPTKALFETVDFYPTLAELAGLPAPTGPQPIDGRTQVPVLKDPVNATVKDYIYHAYPRSRPKFGGEWLGRAIRTERYRYVEWAPLGDPTVKPEIELYDYVTDPLESVNLASERPEIVTELGTILRREPAPRRLPGNQPARQ